MWGVEMKPKYFSLCKNEGGIITCIPVEQMKDFEYAPKIDYKTNDIISINKMLLKNQTLINNIVDRNCKKRLEIILKLLAIIYEDDSDDDDIVNLTLGQITKFRKEVEQKYLDYMETKNSELLLKKLEILEKEIILRKGFLDEIDEEDDDDEPLDHVRSIPEEQQQLFANGFEEEYEEKRGKGR